MRWRHASVRIADKACPRAVVPMFEKRLRGSPPARANSLGHNRHFHGGNTGSNPVRVATLKMLRNRMNTCSLARVAICKEMQEKAPKGTKMAQILAANWQQNIISICAISANRSEKKHFGHRNLQRFAKGVHREVSRYEQGG